MEIFSEQKVSSCCFSPASESSQAGDLECQGCTNLETSFGRVMTVKFRSRGKKSGGKSSYRHVPHSQKPPHLVAKRNARERRRVEAVNEAFQKLRKRVNGEMKQKRLSKVRTLRVAIDYINKLQQMIVDHDSKMEEKRINKLRDISDLTLNRKVSEGNAKVQRRERNTEFSVDNVRETFTNIRTKYSSQEPKFNSNWESSRMVCFPERNADMNHFFPEYGSLGMHEISVLPDM